MSDQLHLDFDAPPCKRMPKMDARLQGASRGVADLPRDVSERGYAELRKEQAEALRKLEARFGVVINRRVRVTIAGFPGEFEGKLMLAQLLYPSKRGEELRLRIGETVFDHSDVESCLVMER